MLMKMILKKETQRRKYRLILGMITGAVMMVLSYLMDGYGLLPEEQALTLRPLWVYPLCMILAMVGVPAMCFALGSWYQIIQDVQAKQWVRRLFLASAASYGISSLYMIAIECLPPVIFQNAIALGIRLEDADTDEHNSASLRRADRCVLFG